MLVRVVLDTCAVRNYLHGSSPSIDFALVQQQKGGVSLSLSASAFIELAGQIADGHIDYATWEQRTPDFDAVLSSRWPCLPNGKQLAFLAGSPTTEPFNVYDESQHMRACWHHLRTVSPDEVRRCKVVYRVSDGTLRSIRLDQSELQKTLGEQRRDWIDYVRKMEDELSAAGITDRDEEKIYQKMYADFDTTPLDIPHAAVRLTSINRMIARFLALALKTRAAYNPETDSRRGDTFDLNLLFYLLLPAIIVTGDGRFVRGLRSAAGSNAQRVLLIDEFNRHLTNNTLASLVSPLRNAEQQFHEWNVAAYTRWEKRNRPANDDWSDWFVTEPIA
jgi:hypothetical protein